jgi:hypothetical protein
MAIDKAKKYGLGMVVVRNSCHYGIAGYYASQACDQGCIGITGTNARPSVAPTFGVDGKIIAPRLVYDAQTKTLTVLKVPTICDLKKLNRARKETKEREASRETKARREPPRDWEEYRRRNNRRRTAASGEAKE